ncbi:MAG: hypothetical protein GEV04_16390 [Actinophytocola sp.]|nr:hypothetical protein [Actinophytocola sp.]
MTGLAGVPSFSTMVAAACNGTSNETPLLIISHVVVKRRPELLDKPEQDLDQFDDGRHVQQVGSGLDHARARQPHHHVSRRAHRAGGNRAGEQATAGVAYGLTPARQDNPVGGNDEQHSNNDDTARSTDG